MTIDTPAARFALLLGLSFFFGLAFEEFHARGKQPRPGGIRSFPLLALTGGLLYRLDTRQLLPMSVGLLVLGVWLAYFYWHRLGETDEQGLTTAGLMAPVCNFLAYVLGPVALAEPPWVAVGATVAAVLFLTARERLHVLARRVDTSEIVTAGKFLMLTGLILPLLPDQRVTQLTGIRGSGSNGAENAFQSYFAPKGSRPRRCRCPKYPKAFKWHGECVPCRRAAGVYPNKVTTACDGQRRLVKWPTRDTGV